MKRTAEANRLEPRLQLVAWEITRKCNLLCAHCRAEAEDQEYVGELSPAECFHVIDSLPEVGQPILILTGGEPLMRPDVFEIGRYAVGKGLRVVLGTNGTLIDRRIALAMKEVPVSRIGVSLDFPTPELQDRFRGKAGAFDAALTGIKQAQRAGIEVQINSTITRLNAPFLKDLLEMALELGVVAFHPFMLVPTGRGRGLADAELSPEEYERILNWFYDRQTELADRIFLKPTDAPHYVRIMSQRGGGDSCAGGRATGSRGHPSGMNRVTRGCLAGVGFCFISHVGRVQGCGYLDVEAGNVKTQAFSEIWEHSVLFERLRDISGISGKCGRCEYKRLCGGCRARAYENTGDYMAEEPYCVYQPAAVGGAVTGCDQ